MKRTVVLLIGVAIATGACCNQNRLDSVSWSNFQESVVPEPVDTTVFAVPVTVRTDSGQEIEVFGQRFDTQGSQWWIFGSWNGIPPAQAERITTPPDVWFWTTEPESLRLYMQASRAFDDSLEQRGLTDVELLAQDPGALSRLEGVPFISDTTEVPLIYLRVNGNVIGLRPYTPHEGWLERIHIDAPEGRSGDEVTVVGYYSRSLEPTALAYPRKKCIWCGDIQVCSADPECPE